MTGPGTLFYLDPPYWGCEGDYGTSMFAREDFTRMAEQLRRIKGRFLLSINDVAEVREIFAGFEMTEVSTVYTVGKANDRRDARAELLVATAPSA